MVVNFNGVSSAWRTDGATIEEEDGYKQNPPDSEHLDFLRAPSFVQKPVKNPHYSNQKRNGHNDGRQNEPD